MASGGPELDLAALQRAFHDACTGAAPLASARDLVREDGVDPARRLGAYAHAYRARIAGVIAADYPKLRALLGEVGFDELVDPYLRAYPTRHPSLREAGLHLAAFLDGEGRAAHAELARLERARVEVFDGPDAAPLSRDDLAALPPEEFPLLRLRLVPASVLVELTTSADDVWDAIEDASDDAGALPAGYAPPAPVPVPVPPGRAVLVWRRDLTVIHRTLEPDEAASLRRLAAPGGATFADVCEALAGSASAVERALELLLRWLDAAALAPAAP